jgi:hypothetical protein
MGLELNQAHYYSCHFWAYCTSSEDSDDCGAVSGMIKWHGDPKYSGETCPSPALPTNDPK